MGTIPENLRDAVAKARIDVAALHAELPRWGLVVWTAGNVSQRVRGEAEKGWRIRARARFVRGYTLHMQFPRINGGYTHEQPLSVAQIGLSARFDRTVFYWFFSDLLADRAPLHRPAGCRRARRSAIRLLKMQESRGSAGSAVADSGGSADLRRSDRSG